LDWESNDGDDFQSNTRRRKNDDRELLFQQGGAARNTIEGVPVFSGIQMVGGLAALVRAAVDPQVLLTPF
jgi:hypothetical protein